MEFGPRNPRNHSLRSDVDDAGDGTQKKTHRILDPNLTALNPFRAPKALPVLIPSNFDPKKGFQLKGLSECARCCSVLVENRCHRSWFICFRRSLLEILVGDRRVCFSLLERGPYCLALSELVYNNNKSLSFVIIPPFRARRHVESSKVGVSGCDISVGSAGELCNGLRLNSSPPL